MSTLEKFLELRTFVAKVEKLGLVYGASFTEYLILRAVDSAGSAGIRRIDLAAETGLSVSGVTRALLPLEKGGYIERQDETLDARVRRVTLSKSGKSLFNDISANVDQRMDQVSDELDALIAALA